MTAEETEDQAGPVKMARLETRNDTASSSTFQRQQPLFGCSPDTRFPSLHRALCSPVFLVYTSSTQASGP
uniref:Uncharacterized protein n=1 Tax=Sphaerodactylus townsendi TaxID=933632 RepID=A0ACB8FLC2_9SAUR